MPRYLKLVGATRLVDQPSKHLFLSEDNEGEPIIHSVSDEDADRLLSLRTTPDLRPVFIEVSGPSEDQADEVGKAREPKRQTYGRRSEQSKTVEV